MSDRQEFEKYPKLAAVIEWYANNVGVPGNEWNKLLREINVALSSLPIDKEAAAKVATDAWNAGIEQVLKDIATTFSLPANQQKADKQSDRDVFKALGDTIENFPKPKATEYLKQFS